jgi:hypothetical protein
MNATPPPLLALRSTVVFELLAVIVTVRSMPMPVITTPPVATATPARSTVTPRGSAWVPPPLHPSPLEALTLVVVDPLMFPTAIKVLKMLNPVRPRPR